MGQCRYLGEPEQLAAGERPAFESLPAAPATVGDQAVALHTSRLFRTISQRADPNVFIEAKIRHYGFDFCPAFWDWIDHAHRSGTVFSIDKVAGELDAVDDDLATWASQRPDAFFLEADAAVVPSLQATSTWANGAGYEPAAVATFLQDADYYLVAHAHAHRHVVVTHEVVAHSTKKIKIPNACLALGVRYLTPFEMLRAERARFVIAS